MKKECMNCNISFEGRKTSKFCCSSCSNQYRSKLYWKDGSKLIKCSICNKSKKPNEFSLRERNNIKSGRKDWCKKCGKAQMETKRRNKTWKDDAAFVLFHNSKARAKRSNIEHTISKEDIIIPNTCPVFGITLKRENRDTWNQAPSLDRIDNSVGYTKDNIIVVSRRANILKRDASVEELTKLAKFYLDLSANM